MYEPIGQGIWDNCNYPYIEGRQEGKGCRFINAGARLGNIKGGGHVFIIGRIIIYIAP